MPPSAAASATAMRTSTASTSSASAMPPQTPSSTRSGAERRSRSSMRTAWRRASATDAEHVRIPLADVGVDADDRARRLGPGPRTALLGGPALVLRQRPRLEVVVDAVDAVDPGRPDRRDADAGRDMDLQHAGGGRPAEHDAEHEQPGHAATAGDSAGDRAGAGECRARAEPGGDRGGGGVDLPGRIEQE